MATGGSGVPWQQAQESWFRSVNDLARHTAWLHAPARMFAVYGIVLFAGVLLLSWLLARRSGDVRRVGASLWAPVGALIALGVNQFLVAAVAEPRPFTDMPGVLVLVHRSTDSSFPSDHAVMAGAVAAGVLLANRRLGLVTAALAVLMAFTRVYVGAHFALDVVVGLAVGAAIALATYAVVRPLINRLLIALTHTQVRSLVVANHAG